TSYYIDAATWYGASDTTRPLAWDSTRDPARSFEAWKQARRLMLELQLEGQAKALLVWADTQIMNMGVRSESLTTAEAEPYYLEATKLARSLGETRPIVLATLVYAWSQEIGGSYVHAVAMISDLLSALDDERDASLVVLLKVNLAYMLRVTGDLPRALQT